MKDQKEFSTQAEKQAAESGVGLTPAVSKELEDYRDWIKKFRAREIGEIKMQKLRLQLGTYAQRQEGVQMQRIKIPGGLLTSAKLRALADVADRYANGFFHFTTREDVQLYYIKLEDCPDMMRDLASAGITTREACGNTVRNITACYRSGISPEEPFAVAPYCEALYQFLVRNKFNQVMGRKFKIAFEGCREDHAGMLFHDLGFHAVIRNEGGRERRGFRTFVGGGLGGMPAFGHLYAEFLPEEELANFAAATVRLFDRYGERKNRMSARMKFLVRKLGWEPFKKALDEERQKIHLPEATADFLKRARTLQNAPQIPNILPKVFPKGAVAQMDQTWLRDSVVPHKFPRFKGVHVRLKLGDLLTEPARKLAAIAETYSQGELRITIQQNLFLPWVPEKLLPDLYQALSEIGLAETGAETLEDTTTCPGADTCRLGITSAKGLGASVSEAMGNGLGRYKDLARNMSVKVSGCPNGCAQHAVASIGFQGAAFKKDERTVPAHEVYVGGQSSFDETRFGERIGKIPARNGPKVVEVLLELFSKEKKDNESFSDCMLRLGKERLQGVIAPFQEVPSFEADPEFYKDWGHENEKFAVRTGIKGECAGAPVQEKAPVMTDAREKLAQAEAFLTHKEFANAQIEAYAAMAQAVRVPLYTALVDPFTEEQALWEFENLFVRSGRADSRWLDFAEKAEREKKAPAHETRVQGLIQLARELCAECERLQAAMIPSEPQKP